MSQFIFDAESFKTFGRCKLFAYSAKRQTYYDPEFSPIRPQIIKAIRNLERNRNTPTIIFKESYRKVTLLALFNLSCNASSRTLMSRDSVHVHFPSS